MFSRLFSILTETTHSEYLRSRRLTEAAIILRDTDEKYLINEFYKNFDSNKFEDFCNENNIKFKRNVHIG